MYSRKKNRVKVAKPCMEKAKQEMWNDFIRVYAQWERTRQLELIPLLCHRLEKLIRLEPKFDPRHYFQVAF